MVVLLSLAWTSGSGAAGEVLQFSSFLGGLGLDTALDVAVDGQGNVYVTGETRSPNFPVKNPIGGFGGDRDGFVTKLDPTLSVVIYSTYLGGANADRAQSIAVDPQGNAYITGFTQSPNFPVTQDALDTTCGSDGACNPGTLVDGRPFYRNDAFVVKLDPAGKLVYGTFLGDQESDSGAGIAVDGLGTAYVTGYTQSARFPTTPGAFQSECRTSGGVAGSCSQDVFVTRINGAGNDLVYSTRLGGSHPDQGMAIALDVKSGIASAAYITGTTQSTTDFPTTPGAFRPIGLGSSEAFVTKLDALGHSLLYSSYLGGSDYDDGRGIAVDGAGSAYVIGQTASADFPTVNAFDSTCGSDGDCNFVGTQRYVDVFVSKVNPQGTGLAYSTYLGGSYIEFAGSIAVDGSLNAYVTGETTSTDFPVVNAVQQANAGGADGFVAKLGPAGNTLDYSTYLGAFASDTGHGISVDGQSNTYISGLAGQDFPTTSYAFQKTYPGSSPGTGVAFVARIGVGSVRPPRWIWAIVTAILLLMMGGWLMLRRRT